MMKIKIKALAVPMFVALSLVFGACAEQTIEAPDAIDGAVEEGVEGIEQGAEDTGNAVEDGLKGLEKDTEDAADAAQDGIKEGLEDTGNAIEDLGDEIPSSEN
ncbi:hypothetical protein IQ255_25045 [Pleurocapsales cyanobacterium LEGE 10410]|nr:hypothetical protein [Pleurocapsales cyanobacterium LEGE 10410]